MGTRTYRKLDQFLRPVASKGLWRIMPRKYIRKPLGMGYGYSRFSAPNREFQILYAADKFTTALRESLIRDNFDKRKIRRIAEQTLRKHASALIKTKEDLLLVDLSDGKASNMGIPSEIRHAKDYKQSQGFALEVYEDMADADGLLFRSRLDDQYCIAVFDRAVSGKLASPQQILLASNPLTRPALKEMNIRTFLWRGKY